MHSEIAAGQSGISTPASESNESPLSQSTAV